MSLKCVICKSGETQPGHTVVTLTRGEFVIVFKNVPADICQNCGEEYVNDNTTTSLLAIANDSFEKGVAVEVRDYKVSAELMRNKWQEKINFNEPEA